jgi:hypothetical protein
MEAPEKEPPYPVIAINDLKEHYSVEHLRFAIQQCRNVVAQVIVEDNTSHQQIVRVNILRYLDLQLERASKWADDDTDLMAEVMRNLIELLFWAEYVSESMDNAERFRKESDVDSKELMERLVKAMNPELITDQIRELAAMDLGKRVPPKRADDQEEFIWKFCSKLIHPSSLIINNPEMTIKAIPFRQFLAIRVVTFAWRIIYNFHNVNFTA